MIELKNKSECCGCTACYSICPVNAIVMKEDKEGFKYPIVDKTKCINCNLCNKVCPFLNTNIKKQELLHKKYIAHTKNINDLMHSSSGGIFTEFAKKIIKNGGFVCAVTNNNNTVEHVIISDEKEIYHLQGSKYVQSKIQGIFKRVKQILDDEKPILFVGTPCQVNGLKLFLKKDYFNLYTFDFICHGVPSAKVYNKWLESLGDVSQLEFRNKDNGWKNYQIKFNRNKKIRKMNYLDCPYMKGFIQNLYLRNSCYECKSKGEHRLSDITLGDCWGVDEKSTIFNKYGNSLIIVNTEKGNKLLKEELSKFDFQKVDTYNFETNNPSYNKSATNSKELRKRFFAIMNQNGIKRAFKKFKLYPTNKRKIMLYLSKIKKKIKRGVK